VRPDIPMLDSQVCWCVTSSFQPVISVSGFGHGEEFCVSVIDKLPVSRDLSS
jgi:hypothetical protein